MKRGEVWLIDLFPILGAEIQKTRPAVIVNDDQVGVLPLKVIVPITEWKDHYSRAAWIVRLEPGPQNGLAKVSAAGAFQVRSLSEQRFVRRLGFIEENLMEQVNRALALVLSIKG